MSDSTSHIDQLSVSQSNKELRINELVDALSPSAVFGRRASTTTGLSWGYYGGRWGGDAIANGVVALDPSATNYIVVERDSGAVSLSAVGSPSEWSDTDAYGRLYKVVTSTTGVLSYEDHRAGPGGIFGGESGSASGGGGSMPGSGWAQYQAALLEPDAIEPAQLDAFSYAIGAGVTKMLLASWNTRLGSAGRMEQRNPQRAMPLRNVTLTGLGSGAVAVLIDPDAATYADPWATYYDRLQTIAELPVKNIALTAASQSKPFLPGAYGAIITQVTCFDFAWIVWRLHGSYGPNLWDEISDTDTQRFGNGLLLPISKRVAGSVESSAAAGVSALGSVSYVLLPSTWSEVPDPVSSAYTFRDDFMGSSLNTSVWTRAQSTAGNVEINTDYQWCKVRGNIAWGGNSARRTASVARSEGRTLVCDVFAPSDATSGQGVAVEWNDGSGFADSNGAHRVEFGDTYVLRIKENGTTRSTLTTAWTAGSLYRVKIELHAGGGATYSIQGGSQYEAIGAATWDDITPGTSNSATNTLHPCFGAYGAHDYYVSDMRLYD
jgi:hypothetical protein